MTSSEGTGLVHTAPPFGEDDYRTGQAYDLPLLLTIDPRHVRNCPASSVRLMVFKDATPDPPDSQPRPLPPHGAHAQLSLLLARDRPPLYSHDSFVRENDHPQAVASEENRRIDWHPPTWARARFGTGGRTCGLALSRRATVTPPPPESASGCTTHVRGLLRELFDKAQKSRRRTSTIGSSTHPAVYREISWPCIHVRAARAPRPHVRRRYDSAPSVRPSYTWQPLPRSPGAGQ